MSLAPLSLVDPEERRSSQPFTIPPSDYPLHLELVQSHGGSHWWKIIAGSLALHALLLSLASKLPTFSAMPQPPRKVVARRVPLYFPRDVLTQKTPNKRDVAKQVDLADLMQTQNQQAQKSSPDRSVKQFELPRTAQSKRPVKTPVSILPDAPAVAVNQANPQPMPGSANGLAVAGAPPPPQSAGPFQNLGAETPPPAHPKIAPPKATVEAAINGLAPSGSGSQVIVTDDSPTRGVAPIPGAVGQLGAQHAGVELKSDPQGLDMRPYLAQILNIVRGNWRRVIPPNARAGGLRGRTVLEFIINRDGSIPKLVTSESSGFDPLDRAAVTGLSMSNPLPPLPPGFKGEQVRLAFSFSYNMAAQ